jgi:hypothetical protein
VDEAGVGATEAGAGAGAGVSATGAATVGVTATAGFSSAGGDFRSGFSKPGDGVEMNGAMNDCAGVCAIGADEITDAGCVEPDDDGDGAGAAAGDATFACARSGIDGCAGKVEACASGVTAS